MKENITSDVINVYAGYINVAGIRVQVDFEAPARATAQEIDLAFLAALRERAMVDYLCIGGHSTAIPPAN